MKFAFLLVLATSEVPAHAQEPAELPFEVAVEEPNGGAPVRAGMGVTPKPAQPGDVIDVAVRIRIAEGWHIYDLNGPSPYSDTELTLDLPAGLEPIGTWQRPASHVYPADRGLRVWTKEALFRHRVRVDRVPAAGSEIACTLSYQTCNADFCYPPSEEELSVSYSGSIDESAAWASHRGTRVLYAGKQGGQREAVFGDFLKEWFDESATLPLQELSMETARDYDVVIVDWMSQYGNDGYPAQGGSLHAVPVNLGADFTKPFIAMTYVGTRVRREYKLDWL